MDPNKNVVASESQLAFVKSSITSLHYTYILHKNAAACTSLGSMMRRFYHHGIIVYHACMHACMHACIDGLYNI